MYRILTIAAAALAAAGCGHDAPAQPRNVSQQAAQAAYSAAAHRDVDAPTDAMTTCARAGRGFDCATRWQVAANDHRAATGTVDADGAASVENITTGE